MDRLRDACILMFARENPARLFDVLGGNEFPNDQGFKQAVDSFVKLGMGEPAMRWYSQGGMEALGAKVEQDWGWPKRDGVGELESGRRSPFHLLARAAEPLILNYDFEPRVKHRHMLRWRALSFEVTGDLLLCAHLAWSDRFQTKQRRFRWPHQPKTDNRRLEGMLSRGMSENHAHLNATAPVFEANWLALMTAPLRHQEALGKWDDRPLHAPAQHDASPVYSIRVTAALAAALRFEIWQELCGMDEQLSIAVRIDKEWRQGIREVPSLSRANEKIEVAVLGRIDYVATNLSNEAPKLVRGERALLYQALHRVYSEKSSSAFEAKLQAYLLLKHRLRREVVQLNNRLGFGNFKFYQDRKMQFLEGHPELYKLAIAEALATACVPERGGSLEFRIGPGKSRVDLKRTIEDIANAFYDRDLTPQDEVMRDLTPGHDAALNRLRERNIFFTLHFFKETEKLHPGQDDAGRFQALYPMRHEELRNEVAKQARGVVELRAEDEVWAKLIRGIDAASSEFFSRPEVFAPAFRLLRRYPYSIRSIPVAGSRDVDRLRVTFHAGEDFYCLTDGMRYVEEAVRLLEFQDGDRIGHGLALGLDARKFFEMKRWEVLLPKQELLDNMTWILWVARMNDIDLPTSLESQITELKTRLFRELGYGKDGTTVDSLQQYEWSYLLRGDDPTVYLRERSAVFPERVFFPEADYPEVWKGDDPKWSVKLDRLRNQKEVQDLVREYHQNPKVRTEGKKMTRFEVPLQLADVLTQIQEKIMSLLQKHHIAIECNPSSNVLISSFDRYIEHPILRFYNRELLAPNEGIEHGLPPSPQLLVSINTDDAGIFGTSLETEYALMARALEKQKDAQGRPVFKPNDVYAWLDKVRLMGMDLSFRDRSTDEMRNR